MGYCVGRWVLAPWSRPPAHPSLLRHPDEFRVINPHCPALEYLRASFSLACFKDYQTRQACSHRPLRLTQCPVPLLACPPALSASNLAPTVARLELPLQAKHKRLLHWVQELVLYPRLLDLTYTQPSEPKGCSACAP
ncbi:hypothetical protein OPQ81_004514 [Rhizoctonia solani]|nr:hypothetical protein OPQ81_004514 [Rhizoctonia solani]